MHLAIVPQGFPQTSNICLPKRTQLFRSFLTGGILTASARRNWAISGNPWDARGRYVTQRDISFFFPARPGWVLTASAALTTTRDVNLRGLTEKVLRFTQTRSTLGLLPKNSTVYRRIFPLLGLTGPPRLHILLLSRSARRHSRVFARGCGDPRSLCVIAARGGQGVPQLRLEVQRSDDTVPPPLRQAMRSQPRFFIIVIDSDYLFVLADN
jgi:hypothetical protein